MELVSEHDDRPKHNENIPYPCIMVVVGKTGSGKTQFIITAILRRAFDFERIMVLSPNIEVKMYKFLNYCFQHKINLEIILDGLPLVERYRSNQMEEVVKSFAENLSDDKKQNNRKYLFTKNVEDMPMISELDDIEKKLAVLDDIQGANAKQYKPIFLDYAKNGRPKNMTVINIGQYYKGIQPRDARDQATCGVFFKTGEANLKAIYEEKIGSCGMMSWNEFSRFCQRSWKNKYDYVYINTEDEIIKNDLYT